MSDDSTPKTLKGRLLRSLFLPVDAASTVFFRVAFGLLMAWGMISLIAGGGFEARYVAPLMRFTYPGFEWVKALPEQWLRLLVALLALSALMIAAGLFYRLATVVFFLGYSYVLLLDAALYNNHYYLFCLFAFLLIFVPAHHYGSVDARRRPSLRSLTIPAWAIWILRFQVGVPYFFGGVAKLNYDWLIRAEPMTLWLRTGATKFPVRLDFFDRDWAGYFFSYSGLVFDLAIVPALLYRKTRPVAFLLVLFFNLFNSQLFNIGLFPWVMIASTAIFFSPDWPRRLGLMRAQRQNKSRRAEGDPSTVTTGQKVAAFGLALYVLVQITLPFRHVLYPGKVDWTEQGHRFAWRMKLRDKSGTVQLVVVDRITKTATFVEGLDAILTPHQKVMMWHDPEMQRQVAHYLADTLRQRGSDDFEIRVRTELSLNAREPQALIDPTVDLASQEAVRFNAPWIMPLEPLPERERRRSRP